MITLFYFTIVVFVFMLVMGLFPHLFLGYLSRHWVHTFLASISSAYWRYAYSKGREDDYFQRFLDFLTSRFYDEQSSFAIELFESLDMHERKLVLHFLNQPNYFHKNGNFFKYFSRTLRDGLFVKVPRRNRYELNPVLKRHIIRTIKTNPKNLFANVPNV
jgi:hypothetical protein